MSRRRVIGLISGFGSLSVSETAGMYLPPGLAMEREARSLHSPSPDEVPAGLPVSGRATGRGGYEKDKKAFWQRDLQGQISSSSSKWRSRAVVGALE